MTHMTKTTYILIIGSFCDELGVWDMIDEVCPTRAQTWIAKKSSQLAFQAKVSVHG